MKQKILKFQLLIILTLPLFLHSQEKKPIKILFVGNSFTYMWNMPQLVSAMAESQGMSMEIFQSTVGGSTLEEHYNKKKGTQTRRMLEDQRWDYVILQDYSSSTLETPDKFNEYASKLSAIIRNKNAEPLLFMTWAYKSNPLMQPTITKEYNRLGDSLNIAVIPVGEIYTYTRTIRPDLKLFFDNKHPTADGSFLIALIFYKALSGNSVANIPESLLTTDIHDQPIILSFISHETADFLKQIVDEYNFNSNKDH